ncbi:MAG: nicotinate (nicotinamide) nucleotide adenylyltransferase [Acidobacteriota bacterium]|nr:nicotinate (nicotinamide) nucleotide adenylyltransferase [Acidobacteriota bacterium]
MRRVGLFGGSFDPPHRGHLVPVLAARRQLELDAVLYLPTARPPHKQHEEQTPAHRRLAMVELALLDHRELQVSDRELTPGRVAYTIDTVEELQAEQPGTRFYLILGSDSFLQLPTWRRWTELAAAVELAVLRRPGSSSLDLPDGAPPELAALAAGSAAGSRVHRIEEEPLPYSSTDLRRCFAEGEEPSPGALDDLVLRYIRKYALYR